MMEPNSRGNHAEAYRKLRVALDFANLQPKARVIMVTSAVEQEGKSTTVANLAVALAQVGRRVVLVDLDLRRPYLDRFFDLGQIPGVTDVALGQLTLARRAPPDRDHAGASSSTARSSRAANGNGHDEAPGRVEGAARSADRRQPATGSGRLPRVRGARRRHAELRERADVVLIDAPPVLPVSDAMAISSRVDGIVIVSRLEVVQRPMLRELRASWTGHVPRLGLVLTGAEPTPRTAMAMATATATGPTARTAESRPQATTTARQLAPAVTNGADTMQRCPVLGTTLLRRRVWRTPPTW